MPFCTGCGQTLDPSSAYCNRCGLQTTKARSVPLVARGATSQTLKVGPESVFFDEQVLTQIISIVTSAENHVMFITPYVGLWGHLKNAIEDAISRGVLISFVVRADEQKQKEDLRWLRGQDIQVYEVPNLHAKIYLNERTVLVSSMNAYWSSTLNSLDFAVMIHDEDEAAKIRQYAAHMVRKLEPNRPTPIAVPSTQQAFCIRDGTSMGFNASRPLCSKCYPKWAKYRNKDYKEGFCHLCGRLTETTFARPFCSSCYKKLH